MEISVLIDGIGLISDWCFKSVLGFGRLGICLYIVVLFFGSEFVFF